MNIPGSVVTIYWHNGYFVAGTCEAAGCTWMSEFKRPIHKKKRIPANELENG
jgi:hypothetical protein